MLPTFLNIGVARSGTTWLHDLLDTHPNVYVPQRRKELHFFSNHYDKGLEWYEQFFPETNQNHSYRAIGEVAAHYLLRHETSAERIAKVDSIQRLTVMLRDPIERAWSHYHWKTRFSEEPKPFKRKVKEVPSIIESGKYATGLKEYEKHFDRSNLLILKSEQAFNDVENAKQKIANFLNIDKAKFPPSAGTTKVRAQLVPRFPSLYKFANRISHGLRKKGVDWLSNTVKQIGLKRILMSSKEKTKEEIPQEVVSWLSEVYDEELEDLEQSFGVETSEWRKNWKNKNTGE